RIREKREERRTNSAAKTTPPADPRHKAAFDLCYELYRCRFGMTPTWGGHETKTLRVFLREHAGISAEEIARRYTHLLASNDRWHMEKHGSLRHLLSNFDRFTEGPIFAVPQKGESNAKPAIDPNQRTDDNLRAAGLRN